MKRPLSVSRRQFLTGASGFTLALPMLSSLWVKRAYGAEPVFVRRPRLFWIATNHGAALESSFFPNESLLTDTQALFTDHNVSVGTLRGMKDASTTQLSPILRAPSELLPERRIAQMNILRGIDVPFGLGHHTGGHLGNYACNEGLAGTAREVQSEPRPTIDQLLAWSPSFYGGMLARERAVVLGTRRISFGYSNPSASSGSIQDIRGEASSLALFHRLFNPGGSPESNRVPVVDRVFDSYRRLRDGNRRLSAADRQRLNDHMDRLAELQRKVNTAAPVACGGVTAPQDDSALHLSLSPADGVRYVQLQNEILAAAFICGATRIAALGIADENRFVDYNGDWHFEVAHYWLEPDKQDMLARTYQRVFESVFLDMAKRLDIEEGGGSTYLDNSLIVWTQESGMSTHDPVSIPIVTAGSGAGFFRTGMLADYRRMGNPESRFQPLTAAPETFAGITYNQFLATVLRGMGMQPAEFERWGHKGYGVPRVEMPGVAVPFAAHYQNTSSRYFQMASDVLPFLKA